MIDEPVFLLLVRMITLTNLPTLLVRLTAKTTIKAGVFLRLP